jgi:hypothetical protein
MSDFTIPADGPIIASGGDFLDTVADAAYGGAERVIIPVERLSPDFFRLSTGLAGDILQKCSNYQLRAVIVGDISAHTSKSGPLRDFIYESNKNGAIRFVPTMDEV